MYVAMYCSFPFPFLALFGVEITQHHFPCYHGGQCTVLRLQSSVGEWEQWERWQHNTLNTGPAYTQLYKSTVVAVQGSQLLKQSTSLAPLLHCSVLCA